MKSTINRFSSITELIRNANLTEGDLEIQIFKRKPNDQEFQLLDLKDQDQVFVIDRIRTANREPVVYSKNIIPQSELEVLPTGINKSTGLSAMIRLSGEETDSFTVVGDNLNDLEMIGSVHNGFAVANANPTVKAAAAFVLARSNDESALLEVIDFAEATWPL
ncbi:HAD hydrolase family protein [Paenibacillus sp. NPDC056579]|uniref:HAD hydrolase family protein n=1 Tax=Paenibacillus sp. NPDC056579 TaxID=3345871 RepID=UPI0036C520C3